MNGTEDAGRQRFWAFYRSNYWLHVIFLAISLAVISCSLLMSVEGPTTVRVPGLTMAMPESCMSRRAWGIDCPGCGLTRSFISMGHGQLRNAFSFNAAGPLLYLFALIQIPWHGYQLFRLLNLRRPVETLWLYVPLFSMSVAVLAQWLWRLFRGDLF